MLMGATARAPRPSTIQVVELFDQYRVSFVSVTQAFNTTSSTGRLATDTVPPITLKQPVEIQRGSIDRQGVAFREFVK
jgi:hypothetical protein